MSDLTDEAKVALERIAPKLNALDAKENAKLRYAAFQDSLYWTDEVLYGPADDDEIILNYLLRYRTSVLIGEPVTTLEWFWNAAKERCPEWPGFLPERIVQTDERRLLYFEWRDAAIKSFEAGIDK